jgi:hypothetical protein
MECNLLFEVWTLLRLDVLYGSLMRIMPPPIHWFMWQVCVCMYTHTAAVALLLLYYCLYCCFTAALRVVLLSDARARAHTHTHTQLAIFLWCTLSFCSLVVPVKVTHTHTHTHTYTHSLSLLLFVGGARQGHGFRRTSAMPSSLY